MKKKAILAIDFEHRNSNPSVVGITANKTDANGEISQAEINWVFYKKENEGTESCNTFLLSEDAVELLMNADEIVVTLNEDPEITGYGITITEGNTLFDLNDKDVVFELAEYIDFQIA